VITHAPKQGKLTTDSPRHVGHTKRPAYFFSNREALPKLRIKRIFLFFFFFFFFTCTS
jgi:hypothetical protein